MFDLLICNCDILVSSGDSYEILHNYDIGIAGNRIDTVQPTEEGMSSDAEKIIDARGLLAIPGFINTHAHIPMVLFRGLVEDVSINAWFNDYIWPLEANLTPGDVYWGAMLGIAEMIEAGVTYVADHYFYMDEVARAVQDAGIRANLSWAVFAHEGEEKLDVTCEFVDKWQGCADNRITTWLGPHAPYTTGPDFLRLCAVKADQLGVGIHTHVSETDEQVKLSFDQYGISPVRMLEETGILNLPTILAHCLYATDADIEILSQYPTGIAHAPKTYLKLGMGAAPVLNFREAGIPVGLATDGSVSSNTLDILEQMRFMVLVGKDRAKDSTVFPIKDVLDTAFRGSANVIKKSDALGDIQVGKLADIVLINQNNLRSFPAFDPAANLIYSSNCSDVDTVICNGDVILSGGELQTIDKKQVKNEVLKRVERLKRRVPDNRIASYPTRYQ